MADGRKPLTVLLSRMSEEDRAALRDSAPNLTIHVGLSREEAIELAPEVHAIDGRYCSPAFLRAAPELRWVQAMSAGAYPSGTMLRSVQAKNHGAVRAEFVIPDLSPDLHVGLFARPGHYPAWIRFANQNGTPQSDRKRDIRGMSIKVCGVGDGVIGGGSTVDFIMISTDVFVTRDAVDFFRLRLATEPFRLLAALRFFLIPPQVRTIRLPSPRAQPSFLSRRGRRPEPAPGRSPPREPRRLPARASPG